MPKSQKRPGGKAVFYKPVGGVTEVRAGYLYKSPPSKLLKAEKSWKKRYFVLFKINEREHLLKYFNSATDRESPLGGIELSQITLLYASPQTHKKWESVEKRFKCSPSCVLYIKTADRDYFLIAETSEEVDGWYTDLFEAMKSRPHKCFSPEEISNGQRKAEIISYPLMRSKSSSISESSDGKIRSMSDPSSNEKPRADQCKRRGSEPQIYDYPKSYLEQLQGDDDVDGDSIGRWRTESIYETMMGIQQQAQAAECENEDFSDSSLKKSVTHVFDKMKTQVFPLQSFDKEATINNRDELRLTSEISSSSSGAGSPVEMLVKRNGTLGIQSSTESLDNISPGEKNIEVNQADLKKHLTVIEVDGKPCVSGWTGQPPGLFYKGDQILGVNDLHTGTVDDFNKYLSKTLKNEVKLTILHLSGYQSLPSPLHLSAE